ncbi:hypothetical protein JW948_07390 [bacterium]|nr:hypothetical protein [bacterium]
MNRKYGLIAASVFMILIGLTRALGGAALIVKGNRVGAGLPITGSAPQIQIAAAGLLVVGILFVYVSISLVRKFTKSAWTGCWIVLALFILGGLLNGFLLYGQPQVKGQVINVIAAGLAGILLLTGRPALKKNN